jgi:hypothetical protein
MPIDVKLEYSTPGACLEAAPRPPTTPLYFLELRILLNCAVGAPCCMRFVAPL